jgi:hypothetical protein
MIVSIPDELVDEIVLLLKTDTRPKANGYGERLLYHTDPGRRIDLTVIDADDFAEAQKDPRVRKLLREADETYGEKS